MNDRTNNFDLIRLVAALEVLAQHSVVHLGSAPAAVRVMHVVVTIAPPLPIFFIVSGTLVTASLERARSLGDFAWRRAVRIYPCLWTCFGVTLLVLATHGALTTTFLGGEFVPWMVAQLTAAQFYNPIALRCVGVGVINGSMWTLPVELGFYAMLPFLLRGSRQRGTFTLLAVIGLSFPLWVESRPPVDGALKVLSILPFTYAWLFALGVLAHLHREAILPLVRGRFVVWAAAYGVVAVSLPGDGDVAMMRLLVFACVLLAAAHTRPQLAARLLHGHDLSFGLYSYHMLVINILVGAGWYGRAIAPAIVLVATTTAAFASWVFVERPTLAWKPLHLTGGVKFLRHLHSAP